MLKDFWKIVERFLRDSRNTNIITDNISWSKLMKKLCKHHKNDNYKLVPKNFVCLQFSKSSSTWQSTKALWIHDIFYVWRYHASHCHENNLNKFASYNSFIFSNAAVTNQFTNFTQIAAWSVKNGYWRLIWTNFESEHGL